MKFTTLSVAGKLKFYPWVVFDQVLQRGSLVRAAGASMARGGGPPIAWADAQQPQAQAQPPAHLKRPGLP